MLGWEVGRDYVFKKEKLQNSIREKSNEIVRCSLALVTKMLLLLLGMREIALPNFLETRCGHTTCFAQWNLSRNDIVASRILWRAGAQCSLMVLSSTLTDYSLDIEDQEQVPLNEAVWTNLQLDSDEHNVIKQVVNLCCFKTLRFGFSFNSLIFLEQFQTEKIVWKNG